MISGLQRSVAPQPGEWVACLKLKSTIKYAVFFSDGKVEMMRLPVGFDRCETSGAHFPLPPPK